MASRFVIDARKGPSALHWKTLAHSTTREDAVACAQYALQNDPSVQAVEVWALPEDELVYSAGRES